MKSLSINAFLPWEIGAILILLGVLFIILGVRQSKKEFDIEKISFTKPTTKIIFGATFLLIGGIQLLPLMK